MARLVLLNFVMYTLQPIHKHFATNNEKERAHRLSHPLWKDSEAVWKDVSPHKRNATCIMDIQDTIIPAVQFELADSVQGSK
jgi:hypothetical protein